ncbi:MAG: hypothetical protein GXP14_13020 [Gammaproteobacteria bacterium]|nr:hypothetical protein [Gammaproteobacteria bacterium]
MKKGQRRVEDEIPKREIITCPFLSGARQGKNSGLRRLLANAMARDLKVFVVPGLDIARVYGLDIEAAGMQVVASPRHASVLLVLGDISPEIREAASIVYAQMLRPKSLFTVGVTDAELLAPLPEADVSVALSQQHLVSGVAAMQAAFAAGSFQLEVSDYDAPMLHVRIEYVCPMHPEVVSDKPGSCPKCGMFLAPREAQASTGKTHTGHEKSYKKTEESHQPIHAQGDQKPMTQVHSNHQQTSVEYICPMHPNVVQNEPGDCPQCGMHLESRDKPVAEHHEPHHLSHEESAVEYTCSMHPEVIQNEPGDCPKCGMHLELRDKPAAEHHHLSQKETLVEYTCSMHPEVVQNEPGDCPKCGMHLEPRDKPAEKHQEHHHLSQKETAVEYTCSMHPEVVQNEPGDCPKCGMHLEPRDKPAEKHHEHHHLSQKKSAVEYTCSMHPEIVQNEPGKCPKCGMFLEPRDKPAEKHHEHHHLSQKETAVEYTCSMHPEVIQNKPGKCPKCGMVLEPREQQVSAHEQDNSHSDDHSAMDHSQMNHDDSGFMSMVDVTKDLPRSSDDLQMEWIDTAFGPFFPGLPSGLQLTFTLDGDTVAGSSAHSVNEKIALLEHSPMHAGCFVKHFLSLDPLTPVSSQGLICQAMENVANITIDPVTAKARIGALERERVASI